MKEHFFLNDYAQLFLTKTKEILLENYLNLNSSIDVDWIARVFNEDRERISKFMRDLINQNYSEEAAKVNESNVGHFEFRPTSSDMDKYVSIFYLFNNLL